MMKLTSMMMVGLLASGSVFAADDVAAEMDNSFAWKSKVSSVTVFKNGLGFFLREGEVSLRDGWCVADAVPPAAFGTLGIFSHAKDQLVDLVGSGPGEIVEFDGTDAGRDVRTKLTRLEAVRYLKVKLTYGSRDAAKTAEGRLVSVGAEYAVLEADNNSFAVPVEKIRKLQVMEKPLRCHVTGDGGKSPEKTTLGMAYLRKGITWIPEYTLKLLDDETAELSLRGTLVNEAEDIVHADVNFVVGVPHFFHSDSLAPLAVGQIIRTIGASVPLSNLTLNSQIMNRAAFANDVRSDQFQAGGGQPAASGGGNIDDVIGNLPQIEAAGGSDFTVYTRKDLTVRAGEKAIVSLFVKKIKYGHVYRWTLPQSVEHFLVLNNNTDTPWTTGPCLVVSDDKALSEDLLKYVPKGGRGELPVTTAINIATEQKEEETNRKLKAYEPSSAFWVDLVSLRGEVGIRNFGKKPAQVIVTMPVTGKPLSASDDGMVSVDPKKLQLLELAGSITWTTTVNPGETHPLTYRYERYVPSR